MNSTDIMKLRILLHVVDVHCTLELKLKNQFDIRTVCFCMYVCCLPHYVLLFVCDVRTSTIVAVTIYSQA